jgi:hypothetical protein
MMAKIAYIIFLRQMQNVHASALNWEGVLRYGTKEILNI